MLSFPTETALTLELWNQVEKKHKSYISQSANLRLLSVSNKRAFNKFSAGCKQFCFHLYTYVRIPLPQTNPKVVTY